MFIPIHHTSQFCWFEDGPFLWGPFQRMGFLESLQNPTWTSHLSTGRLPRAHGRQAVFCMLTIHGFLEKSAGNSKKNGSWLVIPPWNQKFPSENRCLEYDLFPFSGWPIFSGGKRAVSFRDCNFTILLGPFLYRLKGWGFDGSRCKCMFTPKTCIIESKQIIHPWKLTWNPKMEVWKMISLFNWVDFFRFHVNFPGCM